MNQRKLKKLKKWTDTLTDKELKDEYYNVIYQILGSPGEEIYEKIYETGLDISDIFEYEKELSKHADMLEYICAERGIKLWENPAEVI